MYNKLKPLTMSTFETIAQATKPEQLNQVKTIDILALEWFDKVNGNSYFAGTVTVNYGMTDQREYTMPFQYGYGDHYRHMAFKTLEENGEIADRIKYENGCQESIWEYCNRKGIITRNVKHENCKQRELKQFKAKEGQKVAY